MATIAGIATTNDNFNILVAALGFVDSSLPGTNLVATLSDPSADLTVFAPTDAAFGRLATNAGFAGDPTDEAAVTTFLTGLGAETLRDVILYHVSPGSQTLADIDAAGTVNTALGATITANGSTLIDNDPDLDDPTITVSNLPADNGIVHVIDNVLLPIDLPEPPPPPAPTIAEIAISNDSFNILVAALGFVDAELPGTDLVATLSDPSADLTVFAPTDAAFTALAVDQGFDGDVNDEGAVTAFLAGLGAETLRDVILYHVSPGSQTLADIDAAGTINTALGATITADGTTLIDNDPDLTDPTVVIPDLPAGNGIIHAIDRVLLPIDIAQPEPLPTITEIVLASGGTFDTNGEDFDLLLNAVTAAGLGDALNDPNSELTVFAPNDDAFIGLAQTLGFQGDDEEGAFTYIVDTLTLLGRGDAIPLLTEVLTYHVAAGAFDASAVLTGDPITTLQGGTVEADGVMLVDNDPGLPDPMIIATDIPAENGIVHVIDGVLAPIELSAILGATGTDLKIGDDGNDRFFTGRGNDFVDGNGGHDRIGLGSGDDVGFGGDGNDRINGGRGNDLIDGGDGRDHINGGRDDDTIDGGNGNDNINGGRGNDLIDGGEGHDRITGGRDDDTLNGGDGNDFIKGGSGNDLINGGAGFDRLFGGSGHDTFQFSEGNDVDQIYDFRKGQDKIDVSDLGYTSFDQIEHLITRKGWKTEIDFGNGDEIKLLHLRNPLDEGDFVFADPGDVPMM